MHLLGECSEVIRFWVTLVKMLVSDHYLKKWPQNDWKWWFLTIIRKNMHAIQLKLGVYTYWVSVWFRNDSLLGHVGQIWALWWPKKFNWWFPTVIWKSIHTIQSRLGVYTCGVSVQNWFAFWPRWPNFGPLVAKTCMKIGWKWLFPTTTS